jgi:hypothetical protein
MFDVARHRLAPVAGSLCGGQSGREIGRTPEPFPADAGQREDTNQGVAAE